MFCSVASFQVVLLLQVELPLGILPHDWFVNTSDAHLASKAAAAVKLMPPVLFRFLFRTAFLASMLFSAELLVGAGLAFFANIAGALGLCATTYWLPYLIYYKLYGHEMSFRRKVFMRGVCSCVLTHEKSLGSHARLASRDFFSAILF